MIKLITKWALAAVITLIIPVLLWNVWFLDYIDKHGKLWAWVCAPIFALASAAIIVGFSDAKKPLAGGNDGEGRAEINPFWGWMAGALVIEVVIVACSNT